MSKKTKWEIFSSTDSFKYLSLEEREEYRKDKRKEYQKALRLYDKIKKMPIEKPKFNKPSPTHKITKERDDESKK